MIPRQRPAEPRSGDRWKHGSIPVVGLIGAIGGGKSTVAGRLAANGAAVIDADAVGHELLESPAVRGRVIERFGPGVLSAAAGGEGQPARIDRRALGKRVFSDRAALEELEAILHPAMRDRFRREIEHLVPEGRRPCVVLDAAVLLEAGWDELCDRIVYVDAPRDDRLMRVAQARGWSEDVLAARERSQWPAESKRAHADWIINNDGPPSRLDGEVDRLLSWLRAGPSMKVPAAAVPDFREIA